MTKVIVKKKTDQLNYEDFLGGVTRDVTIREVFDGKAEAQYDIAIEGDARFWRPPATVLKQLVAAWGDERVNWVGKRARLYGDPDVMMAGQKVGGIRVSHVSGIDKPVTANLSVTRGKRANHTLEPLPDAPKPPTEAAIANCTDESLLREWWTNFPALQNAINERVAELRADGAS